MLQLQEFKEMKKEWDGFRAQASGSSLARPSTHEDETEGHNTTSIHNLLNTSRRNTISKLSISEIEGSDPTPEMILHAMGETTGDSYSEVRHPDDFMFEIKDGDVSSHGYDLEELEKLGKFCDYCFMSGHYTLQCRKYKAMSVYERLRFVKEKNICWNCIITPTHRSHDYNLKGVCGYRKYKEKCTRKHHISLPKAFNSNESNTYSHKHKGFGNDNGNSGAGNSDQTVKHSNSNFTS